MSDKLQYTDIAEAGALKPLQDELIATIKLFNQLEGDVKAVAVSVKAMLANSSTSNTDGLKKIAESSKLAGQAMTEQDKITKELNKTNAKLNETISGMSDELARAKVELQAANATQKENAKLAADSTGAYDKASITLAKYSKAWKDLAIAGKENSAVAKKLKTDIDALDATLKRVDAATGRHTRNVGNYTGAFNGLNNSVNQLTREMPAFVNSAQTGFMALSNNIPILTDQIAQLKQRNAELNAEGKAGTPIWKAVAGALFSWQTLMGVGITLMVTYGKEIGNAVKGLFGFNSATLNSIELQKQFNDLIEEGVYRVDALTKSQVLQIETDTKLLVIAAKKRGAKQAEIDEIERAGGEKALGVLKDNADRQQALLSAAIEDRRQLELKYNSDKNEDTKKAFDAALELEKRQYQLRDAADSAYEAKRSSNVVAARQKELDILEKAQKEAKRLRAEASKEIIKELEELIKEIEKYQDLAKKYDRELLKAELDENAKKQKEELKAWYINQNDLKAGRDKIRQGIKKEKEQEKKDEAKARQDALRSLENASKEQLDEKEKQIDREISLSERRQSELRDLAMRGSQDAQNNLAFEERKQAELEAKRLKAQKNQRRQELLFAGLRAYSANVEKNPSTALGSTLKDITVLTSALAALPGFIEGTENVAKSLGKPHLSGKDGYIVRVDGSERIVNPEHNRMMGDLTNDELASLANRYNMGLISPTSFDKMPLSRAYNDERLLDETRSVKESIEQLKSTIENRPVVQDRFNEVEKYVEHVITTKHKTEVIKRKGGGLRG